MMALGVDPGSQVTGFGLVQLEGTRLVHIDHGCISTKKAKSFNERLPLIYNGLIEIIDKYSPGVAAVENLFMAKNARSALKLGHARGVAILAIQNRNINVFEYTPLEVKKAVVGYGRADKNQVQQMVSILLNLKKIPITDAADALAVAICHLHTYPRNWNSGA